MDSQISQIVNIGLVNSMAGQHNVVHVGQLNLFMLASSTLFMLTSDVVQACR